ncbi:MAG: hypothetical protein M1832_001831 [Thelocarpon impressellum]|nr:MAG: hypothetical protein M1832_001831 [Thelocarpon impressellum]
MFVEMLADGPPGLELQHPVPVSGQVFLAVPYLEAMVRREGNSIERARDEDECERPVRKQPKGKERAHDEDDWEQLEWDHPEWDAPEWDAPEWDRPEWDHPKWGELACHEHDFEELESEELQSEELQSEELQSEELQSEELQSEELHSEELHSEAPMSDEPADTLEGDESVFEELAEALAVEGRPLETRAGQSMRRRFLNKARNLILPAWALRIILGSQVARPTKDAIRRLASGQVTELSPGMLHVVPVGEYSVEPLV